ncbi:cytochrome P450 [Seohaeicola saemankumensis]|nr:cytochrome P450 [Seohaeicola saemankumensis]MCA0869408.1 cytochrome P450 [Seohaeicola saemankumensis]
MRRFRPIFILGPFVIVTRDDDVRSVLTRNSDFELGEFARSRMLAGRFVLDTDWPRSHAAQLSVLHTAIAETDSREIRTIAEKICQDALTKADVHVDVAALARGVSMAVVEQVHGLPGATEPDARLQGWLTELASAIILMPPPGLSERQSVEKAADGLVSYVRTAIASHPPGQTDADLLSRLLAGVDASDAPDWLDHDWVTRMACGMAIFGMATVVRTASDAMDEILSQPEAVVEGAREAALRAQTDPDPLRRTIYEALRFRPMLPVLARYSPRATLIGTRDARRRIVKAGATVWAPPLAAMHDPRAFAKPGRFVPERDPAQSLVFGAGQHACLGQSFADAALIGIVGTLLRHPSLHRLPGKVGRIRYRGAAAEQLLVGI